MNNVVVLRLFVFPCVRGPCHSPVYQWGIILPLVYDDGAGAHLRTYGARASASS